MFKTYQDFIESGKGIGDRHTITNEIRRKDRKKENLGHRAEERRSENVFLEKVLKPMQINPSLNPNKKIEFCNAGNVQQRV